MFTPFVKMHGAGNDFVVIDNRQHTHPVNAEIARRISHRRYGVGCDQVVVMESSAKADARMRIFNADGGEVGACGNASRCVAWLLMHGNHLTTVNLETEGGVLDCRKSGDWSITVDMGAPRLYWKDIPLARPMDTEILDIAEGELSQPSAVSMGNPHMVFFVDNTVSVPLGKLGPRLEHHAFFPERTNVEAVQVLSAHHLAVRVWERGAGETLACGTGACAALVAAHRRGLCGRSAKVELPGGELEVNWQEGEAGHVFLTGPVALTFEGKLPL